MRVIKIVTNPYTLIISFFMILINGEHLGGFYLLYLLLALPIGAIHSLLALTGVGLLLFVYHKYQRKNLQTVESILNLAGMLFLFSSLSFFFINDKEHYNYGTFHQKIPLITLILFGFIALCFLLKNLYIIVKNKVTDNKLSLPKT